jgi:hypothetical protein
MGWPTRWWITLITKNQLNGEALLVRVTSPSAAGTSGVTPKFTDTHEVHRRVIAPLALK